MSTSSMAGANERPENRLGTGFGPKVRIGFVPTRGGNRDWKGLTAETGSGRWLFSYGTAIAFVPKNPESYFRKYGDPDMERVPGTVPRTYLDRRNWNRSATTGRHLREFLSTGIAGIRDGILAGDMVLVDLN